MARFAAPIFWRWVLATALAELFAQIVSIVFGYAATSSIGERSVVVHAVVMGITGMIEGTLLGVAQWSMVLRRWVPEMSGRRYVIATSIALGVGWLTGMALSLLEPEGAMSFAGQAPYALALGACLGLAVGGCQAFTLKPHVQSVTAIFIANVVAWPLALLAGLAAATLVPFGPWGMAGVAYGVLGAACGGAIVGLVTGVVVVRLRLVDSSSE